MRVEDISEGTTQDIPGLVVFTKSLQYNQVRASSNSEYQPQTSDSIIIVVLKEGFWG
jgi:hypothetical protein